MSIDGRVEDGWFTLSNVCSREWVNRDRDQVVAIDHAGFWPAISSPDLHFRTRGGEVERRAGAGRR